MPRVKEPKFFALDGSADFGFEAPYQLPEEVARVAHLDDYKALFADSPDAHVRGEASTWYLHTPGTAYRIRSHIPNVKLIVILRDPVERAYSNFLHNRNYLKIEPHYSFEEAVRAEEERRKQNWGHPWYYVDIGCYYKHLKPYFDCFDRSQIRVHLTEDLRRQPERVVQELYRFLEVDPSFAPDVTRRYNVSLDSRRSRWLHRFLNQSHPAKELIKPFLPQDVLRRLKIAANNRNKTQPGISAAVRREIINALRVDILQLQELIQRDLSSWLEV